jgi:membrane-associated phospholipid phosphatase
MKPNIHLFIDRSPELPYFILAVIYLFSTSAPGSAHIFAMAFLFVAVSLVVGLALKSFFKTKRPIRHYNLPALRYDFPSLHSMISIGTIVFVYHFNPDYSLVLIPVGLFYLYSRLKLKAHSIEGVVGGVVLGLILGFLFGRFSTVFYLPEVVEMALAIMLFCTPLMTAVFRMKYSERMDF